MIKYWILTLSPAVVLSLSACGTTTPTPETATDPTPTHCEQLAHDIYRAKNMGRVALYGYPWYPGPGVGVRYVRNRSLIDSEIRRIDHLETLYHRDCASPSTH